MLFEYGFRICRLSDRERRDEKFSIIRFDSDKHHSCATSSDMEYVFQIKFEGKVMEFIGKDKDYNTFRNQFFKNVERKKKLEAI